MEVTNKSTITFKIFYIWVEEISQFVKYLLCKTKDLVKSPESAF